MFKKITTLLIFLLGITPFAYAQDRKSDLNLNLKHQKSLKLYGGIHFLSEEQPFEKEKIGHVFFNPTFQWVGKHHNIEEIGLNAMSFDNFERELFQGNSFYGVHSGHLSLSYEYRYTFLKQHNSRWLPSIGLQAAPFFSWGKGIGAIMTFRQESPVPVTVNYFRAGIRLLLDPHLTYALSDKFYLDLSVLFDLGECSYIHKVVEGINPPQKINRKYNDTGTEGPSWVKSGIRLGLGWNI